MYGYSIPRGSIQFRLFDIPVIITPISWAILGILGGAFRLGECVAVSDVLMFIIAGMLCLLVHEFGHALAGRKAGGGTPYIIIGNCGGVTVFPFGTRTKLGYALMVLAGPLATLVLGALAYLAFHLGLNAHCGDGTDVYPLTRGTVFALEFSYVLFRVCLIWGIFNLLPIFPLDGSHLLNCVVRTRIVAGIGLVTSGGLCILGLMSGSIFNILICAYLFYINLQYLRR